MGDLTENFDKKEFECACCGENAISIPFVKKLQEVRSQAGFPINITSGFRCSANNSRVGGSPVSSHLRGLAADIYVPNDTQRYRLLELAFERGFRRIGVGPNMIHLDVDETLDQKVLWGYAVQQRNGH